MVKTNLLSMLVAVLIPVIDFTVYAICLEIHLRRLRKKGIQEALKMYKAYNAAGNNL